MPIKKGFRDYLKQVFTTLKQVFTTLKQVFTTLKTSFYDFKNKFILKSCLYMIYMI